MMKCFAATESGGLTILCKILVELSTKHGSKLVCIMASKGTQDLLLKSWKMIEMVEWTVHLKVWESSTHLRGI